MHLVAQALHRPRELELGGKLRPSGRVPELDPAPREGEERCAGSTDVGRDLPIHAAMVARIPPLARCGWHHAIPVHPQPVSSRSPNRMLVVCRRVAIPSHDSC